MRNEVDIEMEEIDCPFCGGPKHLLLHREDSLQMVRCSSCRFIYLNPRPTSRSLLRFYQDYLPEDESSVEAWQEMRGRGWEVVGVEISQKAIDHAKHSLGLTIYPGPLEKVGFLESDFDVVS